jgi:hypothetical protein
LPAVIVPSGRKTGFSAANASSVVPGRLCSVFRQAELARHDDGDGCERLVDLDSLDVA